MRVRGNGVCRGSLVLSVWLACAAAHADERPLHVRVERGGCPSAALVRERLAPLVEGERALAVSEAATSRDVQSAEVEDRGEVYRVTIGGAVRELRDERRDCVERARVAAIFIALNAHDGEAAGERPLRPLTYGMRALAELAYLPELERFGAGGSVAPWLALGRLRLALSAGAFSPLRVAPVEATSETGAARLVRVPVALQTSYWLHRRALGVAPSLGFGLELMHIRGAELPRTERALRVTASGALALDAAVQITERLAISLRLSVTALARAYRLQVEPAGALGRTPRLIVGAALGIDWAFAKKGAPD